MKLDSMEKRIGLLLIIAGLIVLAILLGVWIFSKPQLIAYHMPQGQVIYYKRGLMESSLVDWLFITLIALPLFMVGFALLLGYGGKIINWIRYGNPEEKNDGKEPADNDENQFYQPRK